MSDRDIQDYDDMSTQGEDTGNQNPKASDAAAKEKEIDLLELFHSLWSQKKLLFTWCLAGAIAGLIIAFSIPKEYTTGVKLAPETTNNRTAMGGLSTLAGLAGFSTVNTGGTDAVYPQLYPDVLNSVPFSTSLFDVKVRTKKGNKEYTVREYLEEETRKPWWSYVIAIPGKALGMFSDKKAEKDTLHVIDNFELTPEEMKIVGELSQRIKAEVDQKTNVVTINVEMQDPMVSAILADTVVRRLQEYVTAYRTNKARKDLEYAEKLNEEAQQEYYNAQQKLADYADRNQNLATRSAQITRDRLDNEASLAFNLYNQTAQQVQAAKAKVQETTPVYAVVTPATVPMKPTSPRKGLIIGGCAFLGLISCAAWILFGRPMKEEYKNKVKNNPAKA